MVEVSVDEYLVFRFFTIEQSRWTKSTQINRFCEQIIFESKMNFNLRKQSKRRRINILNVGMTQHEKLLTFQILDMQIPDVPSDTYKISVIFVI